MRLKLPHIISHLAFDVDRFLVRMKYFINEGECFIRISKHEKTDKRTRPKAECFYCLRVFGNPDETRSPSL